MLPPTSNSRAQRRRAVLDLQRTMMAVDDAQRRKALDRVASDLGGQVDVSMTRFMTRDEVVELARHDNISIGSHTVTHPLLHTLSPRAQAAEASHSKATLEHLLSQPIEVGYYNFYPVVDAYHEGEAGEGEVVLALREKI